MGLATTRLYCRICQTQCKELSMARYRPKWRQRREDHRPHVWEGVPALIAEHRREWLEKQAHRGRVKKAKGRLRQKPQRTLSCRMIASP
jgi:hypothetical protein